MPDLYCPRCRLMLFEHGLGQLDPRHCPRCAAHSRRVGLVPLRAGAHRPRGELTLEPQHRPPARSDR